MLRIFGDSPFEERAGFGGAFETKEALAEMGAGINVLRVAFKGSAIAGFGFVELASLEINVAQLKVMVSFVKVMDLGLEFFDSAAIVGAREFKTACGRN